MRFIAVLRAIAKLARAQSHEELDLAVSARSSLASNNLR
jgi:hypothetical protein